MSLNIYAIELQNWIKEHSFEYISNVLKNKPQNYTIKIHVFYSAGRVYSFLVTSEDFSKRLVDTPEFQEVCRTENIGIIKEIILTFKNYIRSKGYLGNVEIAPILED